MRAIWCNHGTLLGAALGLLLMLSFACGRRDRAFGGSTGGPAVTSSTTDTSGTTGGAGSGSGGEAGTTISETTTPSGGTGGFASGGYGGMAGGGSGGLGGFGGGGQSPVMPDFSLPDVNATSPSFGQMVSPRDYLKQVSAWYFGHAT